MGSLAIQRFNVFTPVRATTDLNANNPRSRSDLGLWEAVTSVGQPGDVPSHPLLHYRISTAPVGEPVTTTMKSIHRADLIARVHVHWGEVTPGSKTERNAGLWTPAGADCARWLHVVNQVKARVPMPPPANLTRGEKWMWPADRNGRIRLSDATRFSSV